jgi:hypothetical protein
VRTIVNGDMFSQYIAAPTKSTVEILNEVTILIASLTNWFSDLGIKNIKHFKFS